MAGFFVTGTDTDSGKTYSTVALIHALRRQGYSVAPYKPVAAGSQLIQKKLRNDDALKLITASGVDYPYSLVNPYCFEPPIAPHIAAQELGVEIKADVLLDNYRQLSTMADVVVVEGAGGWLVPLSPSLDIAGLAVLLDIPVILIVGLKLGCLNHALLSAQSILSSGSSLAGWIGCENGDVMDRKTENIETLERLLPICCLGVLPHDARSKPDSISLLLDSSVLHL